MVAAKPRVSGMTRRSPPFAMYDDRPAEHVLNHVIGMDDGGLRAPTPAVDGESHHEALALVGASCGGLEERVGCGVGERRCRFHPWER